MNPTTTKKYTAQAAREAQAANYGNKSYWDYLEQNSHELHTYWMGKGDEKQAKEMLTRSLSDALKGNDGD